MKQEKLQEKILMSCLDDGIIQAQTLSVLYDKQQHLKKFIYLLTKQGYLNNQKRTIKYQGSRCDVSYKTITAKGIQWLIDNSSNTYTWLKYMPNPMCNFSIKVSNTNEGTNRHLKKKTASVIFSQMGILSDTSKIHHSSNKIKTLREYIEEAKNKEAQDKRHNETNLTQSEEQYNQTVDYINLHSDKLEYPLSKQYRDKFYCSELIKDYFRYSREEILQYKFANYLGVLISRQKSYLVYHTTPRGIYITSTATDRTKQSVKWFFKDKNITPEIFDYLEYGIIFCKNSREFENAIKDPYNQRKNNDITLQFKNLYVLPVICETIPLLSKILSYKDNFHSKIKQLLLKTDLNIQEKSEKICELLINKSEACICIDMDMGILNRFAKRATNNPDTKYIGICFEWQIEYLKRILPSNVDFYCVSKDILQKTKI